MPTYFINKNILIFFSLISLNKNDIICFEPSRLIKSGKINKIIFNKTETLSNNDLEIYGYHPVSHNNTNDLIFKYYSKNQNKDLNKSLFDYYLNYVNNNKSEFFSTMFLECLLCCNSIEKFDMDFFGKNIEIEIFNDMKWNMKQIEENEKDGDKGNNFKENKNKEKLKFGNKYYYINNQIYDIFPKNYYQLSKNSNKMDMNKIETKKDIKLNYSRTSSFRTTSSLYNKIQLDLLRLIIIHIN